MDGDLSALVTRTNQGCESFAPVFAPAGGIGDFNHDGHMDLLWRNKSTGLVFAWLLQNGNYSSSLTIGSLL